MAHTSNGVDYKPLDSSRREIRLLRIHYDDDDQKTSFRSSLITVSLDNRTFYQALSYCWGDPLITDAITVENQPVSVTTNLAAAFRELRRREVRTIWVDAVCINQLDDVEKGLQVAVMGFIYSRASSVFAWLGTGTAHSDVLMDQIGLASSRMHKYTNQHLSHTFIASGRDARDELRRFFLNPYWSRAWILQEVAKARQVIVLYGSRSLHWDTVATSSLTLPKSLLVIQEFRASAQQNNQPLRLLDALLRTTHLQASDERDKIYSLLPLASDSHCFARPDYRESATSISVAICKIMITKESRLPLYLSNYWDKSAEWTRVAPSWATDLTHLYPELPPWIGWALRRLSFDRGNMRMPESDRVAQDASSSLRLRCVGSIAIQDIAIDVDLAHFCSHGCEKISDTWEGRSVHDMASRTTTPDSKQRHKLIFDKLWWGITSPSSGEITRLSNDLDRGFDRFRERWGSVESRLACGSNSSNYLRKWLSINDKFLICHPWGARVQQLLGVEVYTLAVTTGESGQCYDYYRMLASSAALAMASYYHSRVALLEGDEIYLLPEKYEPGDQIFYLTGCYLPVVLRPVHGGEETYTYVGELGMNSSDSGVVQPPWSGLAAQTPES